MSILAVYALTVSRRVLDNGVLRAASATQGSDMVSPINRLALVYRVNLEQGLCFMSGNLPNGTP